LKPCEGWNQAVSGQVILMLEMRAKIGNNWFKYLANIIDILDTSR